MPTSSVIRLITAYKPIDKGRSRFVELNYNDGAVVVVSRTTLRQRMQKLFTKGELKEAEYISRIISELYD